MSNRYHPHDHRMCILSVWNKHSVCVDIPARVTIQTNVTRASERKHIWATILIPRWPQFPVQFGSNHCSESSWSRFEHFSVHWSIAQNHSYSPYKVISGHYLPPFICKVIFTIRSSYCLHLPLFTYIWHNVALNTLIWSYLPLIALIWPYVQYLPQIGILLLRLHHCAKC